MAGLKDARIRELYESGSDAAEIARAVSMTTGGVSAALRRMGERGEVKPAPAPENAPPKARPWSAEEAERLAEMRAAGVTVVECARQLDRTKAAVERYLATHDMVRGRVEPDERPTPWEQLTHERRRTILRLKPNWLRPWEEMEE